jgi:hypothetical protein
MSLYPSRRAVRIPVVAGTVVSVALVGVLGAVPQQATAAPAPDCAVPFPVSEIGEGVSVRGLTVSKGTTPEGFTGEVLGVLEDGIAPGLDMIVADLESPAIDAAGGIWQGMSGSPVYAEDGRLLGAVAYGLAYGSSPVAGITPFEDMVGYLGAARPAPAVEVGPRLARRIAAETDVSAAQAARGLRHLPMPTGVSGVGLDRAGAVAKDRKRPYLAGDAYRMNGASGASGADIDTVVAGGNIAAVESVGDITSAGVGTATSVCDGRVVAFGHPMSFSGETTLGLAAADAIYVQADPLGVPFKVANVGELGGTITDDRLAGIAGAFGDTPPVVPFVSELGYRDRARTGTTRVLQAGALAAIAFYGNIANHDRVIDGVVGGSETQRWIIKGTRGNGSRFSIDYTDRYTDASDVVAPGAFGLPDLLSTMSGLGATITSVRNVVDVTSSRRVLRIKRVLQRTDGRWVNVTNRTATVRAGRTLVLRAELEGNDGSKRTVGYAVPIPKRLAGRTGSLSVEGGNAGWDDFYSFQSIAAVEKALRSRLRNDEVRWGLRIGGGAHKLSRTKVAGPLSAVVGGVRGVRVSVR